MNVLLPRALLVNLVNALLRLLICLFVVLDP